MTAGAAPEGAAAAAAPEGAAPGEPRIRPATADDLPICAAIWRDALNDYLGRLAQPEIPTEFGPILRLYSHLIVTDPTTFLVAERAGDGQAGAAETGSGNAGGGGAGGASSTARRAGPGADSATIDAFVVVVRRERLTFLSMLFVRPGAQGRGLGRALLARAMPAAAADPADPVSTWRATATDSVQPISNGLYGSLGLVPRIPLLRLVGLPERPDAFGPMPDGVEAVAFDEVPDGPDGLGRAALTSELSALDRDAAGFDRTPDHAFHALEDRIGFLFRDRTGRAVGYGYTSEAGRIGPVAVADPALLGPVVGHLTRVVQPRGAFGIWVPGTAGEAVVPLLRAGFRFEGFPVLLCWDRPFADFSRFIPMSPGLL